MRELQRKRYPQAPGKQESIRTPQTLLPAINLTYCITGLSLRTGATDQQYKRSSVNIAERSLHFFFFLKTQKKQVDIFKEQRAHLICFKSSIKSTHIHMMSFQVVREKFTQNYPEIFSSDLKSINTSVRTIFPDEYNLTLLSWHMYTRLWTLSGA